TVDLDEPQGNWLFKRLWWERAESKYEKVRTQVEAVFESRMKFFAQRAELDKNVFDPFYITIGLSQGELQEILTSLTAQLEQERKEEGKLSESEREFLDTLREQKVVLEQMKLDVEAINKIDHEIDEALNKLLEQINRVRGYEREVWQYFKEIARVLNDKKAREIFYKIDITLKNVSDINCYIRQAFNDHFNKLVTAAREQVERVKMEVNALREKGIDFKEQLKSIDQQKSLRGMIKPAQEEFEETESAGFFQNYIVRPLKTTMSYIGSGLKGFWDGIVYIIRWPIEKITGGGSAVDQEETAQKKEE
ncbi:MAG: hypothetical protein Q8Q25_01135, partial [bacterium]|nr:hypothetical protein [bacterium]